VTIRLDRLVGREVLTANNRRLGRLEEFRAERRDGEWVVVAYVIGAAGLLERLGVGARMLAGQKRRGFVARWDQLDLSSPDGPRLSCSVDELTRL
jgi:sporulation protein YlmC with PRC-barrel domain